MPASNMPTTAVCDALPLGALIVDRDLVVYEWNATLATWTGIERQQMLGRSLLEQYPTLAGGRTIERLRSVFEDGAPPLVLSASLHRFLLPIALPDGSWMPQHTHARRLPRVPKEPEKQFVLVTIENQAQPLAQLETLREERRRLAKSQVSLQEQHAKLEATNAALAIARDKAEHASRSKSDFLANMSHEIRTPLTAILGYADILLQEQDPDLLRDATSTIRRNGDHLLAIVNDILDLSKIEAGRMQVELAPCQPLDVAREVLSLMRVRAEEKSLDLRLTVRGEPPRFASDAIRLRQVLLNLIGNAIKFTNSGSVELAVDWSEEANTLRLDVIDTGIGIAQDKLEAIFQPFTQADTSPKRRYGGTGLGLTICRRLGKMLGGELLATSEPGVGSTFSLVLPVQPLAEEHADTRSDQAKRPHNASGSLQQEDATTGQAADPNADADPPNHAQRSNNESPLAGRRILVAEDGPDNQRLIRYLLEKAGVDATIVENGQQAVDTLLDPATPPFDLVLMDMQMPVLDGYNATRTLRERGYTGPIIALTAHAMDGDRQKTINAGCTDYAAKPFNPPRLFSLLEQYCGAAERAPTTVAATTL